MHMQLGIVSVRVELNIVLVYHISQVRDIEHE